MVEGPLTGIRVVELCSWFTGPMTACILADQGADVIKVEAPGGDPFRQSGTSRGGVGAMFLAANRNKRSVVLNLKDPAQQEMMRQLVDQADVFIQNARPGVMERLGLTSAVLRERNPRLVYASISGFGPTGPLAHQGAYDPIIQAMTGMLVVQGSDDAPAMIRTMTPDKTMGPVVAQAITGALFQRERTGRGCTIDCAMLDAMIWWMWPDAMMNQALMGAGVQHGAEISVANPICPTKDGFIVVSPHQQKDWEAFTEIVGRPELRTDSRFATPYDRMSNLDDYYAAVRSSLKARPTAEWHALFSSREIPCAPVLRREEILSNQQVRWNGIIDEAEHPQAGRYRMVHMPARFDGAFVDGGRPAPALGEHTEDVLGELGLSPLPARA